MDARSARLLLAGVALLLGCQPPRAERVVLVTIDTLRADRLGCYGGPAPTPALDALAARGVRFETAISPAPITLPSHTSLLTGLAPPRHGVRNNSGFRLGADLPTLAERMDEAGLATAAFVGAMVLDRQYGLARGFDVYDDRMTLNRASEGFPERSAGQVIDAVLRWMEQAPDRFFLWVHLYDPHADYAPPHDAPGRVLGSAYLAEVVYTDTQVGRLLDALAERWSDGRTLVAVTSDHGESLGEHGEPTHSLSLYDATQHVPLLLAGPGVPGGRVVRTPVRLVDVAPTLLARAGAGPLPDIDGADLTPLFAREEPAPRSAYLETLATQLDYGWSPLYGVRSGGFKYVQAPRPELYDLAADPKELHDVSAERPEVAARLERELRDFLARARPIESNLELDDEARRQLEQLGYVALAPEPTDLGRVGGIDPKDGMAEVARLSEALYIARTGRAREMLPYVARMEPSGFFDASVGVEVALLARDAQTAVRFARAAVVAAPGFWESYRLLGLALLNAGALDESEDAFQKAAELAPAEGRPLLGLGRVAAARGERERARAFFERAIEQRGQSAEALWRLAVLHIEDGDFAGAQALLERVPSQFLYRPTPALHLAEAELAAGRPAHALARLDRALRAWPQDADLLAARARIEARAAPP